DPIGQPGAERNLRNLEIAAAELASPHRASPSCRAMKRARPAPVPHQPSERGGGHANWGAMPRFWLATPILLLTACGLPRDPEKTSERVASTHELRVGVTDNRAWADASTTEPSGLEPDLVREFAGRIGAHVLWSR